MLDTTATAMHPAKGKNRTFRPWPKPLAARKQPVRDATGTISWVDADLAEIEARVLANGKQG